MSLSDLPDDILNLISIRLNGFDNCSLWMASDSKLKERLVNNVITDFDIKYTIPGRYLWPGNFLKKLQRLSRLSLVVDHDVYHLPIHNIEIHPMPTLKYLKFDFVNSSLIFDVFCSHFSNNLHQIYRDYFSNLEHLEIIRPPNSHTWFFQLLVYLPQKLKTLLIRFTFPTPFNKDIFDAFEAQLPRTLNTLDFRVSCSSLPLLDFSKLPNLTNLTTNANIDQSTYHLIPKSLKSLHILNQTDGIEKLSPYLPTGLEELTITIDQNPPTSQMFSHLTNLKILSIETKKKLEFDGLVINCPPKLQSLTCNKFVLNMWNLTFPLPSRLFSDCLTKLVLKDAVGIVSEFVSMLPQSLTELTINQRYSDHEPFAFFSLLPRNLKSLTTNLPIIQETSCLPDSLTYLYSSSPMPYNDHQRLPSKLETFIVTQHVPISTMKRLPASLTDLHFTSDELVDDEMIRMLPRGLKHFTLHAPDNITDASAMDLPPSLRTLFLLYNMKITDDTIAKLPRSLMRLSLPHNPNFTDECIKHLPPKLIELSLGDTTKITSKSCQYLPKYLRILSLPRCNDWDPKMLESSQTELPIYTRVRIGNTEAAATWEKLQLERKSKEPEIQFSPLIKESDAI